MIPVGYDILCKPPFEDHKDNGIKSGLGYNWMRLMPNPIHAILWYCLYMSTELLKVHNMLLEYSKKHDLQPSNIIVHYTKCCHILIEVFLQIFSHSNHCPAIEVAKFRTGSQGVPSRKA